MIFFIYFIRQSGKFKAIFITKSSLLRKSSWQYMTACANKTDLSIRPAWLTAARPGPSTEGLLQNALAGK
jgi:hypothetical protein